MGIKLCGHQVRWHKPIKLFTFMRASCLVLMIGTIAVPPATASDFSAKDKASTGAAVATTLSSKDGSAPAMNYKPQPRPQRTAGTPSMSPALALAMALGLRSVQGPVVRRQQIAVRHDTPVAVRKQGFLLGGAGKKTSSNAAGIRLALED